MTISFIYLAYSFISKNWSQSWIIWSLAGIAYGILEAILSLNQFQNNTSKKEALCSENDSATL